MKIVCLEPLAVDEQIVQDLMADMKNEGHEFVYYTEKKADAASLIERGRDADIIIDDNTPLTAETINGFEKAKYIAVAFTGVDHVDLDACRAKGISVSNAAGYSTNGVAELVFGLIISLYRNIIPCDGRVRTGGTKDGLVGPEMKGKTLGVIGTGAIGMRVIEIAKVFGCSIIAFSRTEKPEALAMGVKYVSLDELMRSSDIITLHTPNNAETRGLIGKDKIALMKKTAVFINCARGPIVDNAALADALNRGAIAGAGIDVFDMEPPIPEDYPLVSAKNTVLTPHVAFATDEAMIIRAEITADNVRHYLNGDQINVIL
ncbi:MAG: 2-hydroxyacid dehydrogenase [Eubacteriaceae bacterium]|jgi:D-3-phosphoglycerate dehydrogenase|nr:2-hydroxyacid dehydrogenase [Eubacteriaceae bacterium]